MKKSIPESEQEDKNEFVSAYVLTIHEHDTQVKIHGPFESEDQAIEFGDEWQAVNDDSPFWNVIWYQGSPIVPQKPFIEGSKRFIGCEDNSDQLEFEFASDFNN